MKLVTRAILAIHAVKLVIACSADPDTAPFAKRQDTGTCPYPSCQQQAETSQWVVEHFDYHAGYVYVTPSHQNSHGYVSFQLWNTAAPTYTVTCAASSDQFSYFFYGEQWYDCTLPSGAPPGAAVRFQYNRPTGELVVNGTIVCMDSVRQTATIFPSVGTTNVRLACTDQTTIDPDWYPGSAGFYSNREIKCVPDSCVPIL